MENEELLREEEASILTLTGDNGEEIDFEYLDCVEFNGVEYLVLLPVEEEANQIVILEIQPVDEETENYMAVEDEQILNAVYCIFRERYQDILNFAEDE